MKNGMSQNRPATFLGANSSHGFVSKFAKSYSVHNNDCAYIIKGGPGTGKSGMMKYIASRLEDRGIECEYSFCSSDPDSLDGLVIPGKRTVILDGTPPHTVEPQFPGICERLVPISEYIDSQKLEKNRDELLKLFKSNSSLHAKTSRFLAATGELLDDSFSLDCKWTRQDDIVQFAEKICRNIFDERDFQREYPPTESIRFLSGITPKGLVFFEDTLSYYADKIYAVEDAFGATSSVFMSSVRNIALEMGADVITCLCPISPHRKIDHVILPQIGVAFCTTNRFLKVSCNNMRRIHARRFRDSSKAKERKERLDFNTRAAEELLENARGFLKNAKEVHDMIEKYYIAATDFEKVNQYRDKILNEIESREDFRHIFYKKDNLR